MAEYFTAFKERKVRPTFSAHFQEFRQKGAEVEEKRVDGGAATSKCSTHPYSIPPRLSSTIPTAANHCCCSGGRGRATVCGGGVGVAAVTAACLFFPVAGYSGMERRVGGTCCSPRGRQRRRRRRYTHNLQLISLWHRPPARKTEVQRALK